MTNDPKLGKLVREYEYALKKAFDELWEAEQFRTALKPEAFFEIFRMGFDAGVDYQLARD